MQRRDLHVALADGQIRDVAVEQFAAVRRFHVFVVRHATFRFAAQRNPAFRTEAESQCPVDDRLRAGLDSNLIKPGIARLRECLHEIERALIALFPIVKRKVADLNSGDALIKIVRTNGTSLECRNSDRDFEN